MQGKNLTTEKKSWQMLGSMTVAVVLSLLVSSGLASSATAGASYKTLHRFNHKDGYSYAGLTFDAAGNLYGTSRGGTSNSLGMVFELTPNGDGSWKESVLHLFNHDGKDGYEPYASVTFDGAGNLYARRRTAVPARAVPSPVAERCLS